MTDRRQFLQGTALGLIAGSTGLSAWAEEEFPNHALTMLVPFPPGGVADTVGRPVAEAMGRALKQPVVVENKGGAGGGIGMAQVAKSRADGYSLLMALSSVVVLPEADEFDVDVKESDIRRDTFCSSGPGGQSVNTTYSAVRLTHIPTGIVVICQDQKSQVKNLEKAMSVLRSRIYEKEHQKYLDEVSSKRKTMVSSGDRSAKIRTYNYPQSRVTDHRIHLTLYNLQTVIDGGGVQELIDALQLAENAERLKAAGEEI